MHIVYYVRPGDYNSELRFSLRSLSNLPVDTVTIIGYKPAWVHDVHYIAGNLMKGKRANGIDNMRIAATHDSISDEFVLFNDDMYVTAPIDEIPAVQRGTLTEHAAQLNGSQYSQVLTDTADLLDTHGLPTVDYELHTPMAINKAGFAGAFDIIAQSEKPVAPRSIYGNLHSLDAEHIDDVKLYPGDTRIPRGPHPFLSTVDTSLDLAAKYLRSLFPDPCRYET